ncbi:hypothetical protein MASR2M17_17120 [Aminivibrio sp.]
MDRWPHPSVGDSLMVWGPGTVAVRPEKFPELPRNICLSLVKHGFQTVLFYESPHVERAPYRPDDAKLKWSMMWNPVSSTGGVSSSRRPENSRQQRSHGPWAREQAGTSVLLYLRPDLVKNGAGGRTEPKVNLPRHRNLLAHPLDPDTLMIGDATGATREKGQEIVEKGLERMIAFLKQW